MNREESGAGQRLLNDVLSEHSPDRAPGSKEAALAAFPAAGSCAACDASVQRQNSGNGNRVVVYQHKWRFGSRPADSASKQQAPAREG